MQSPFAIGLASIVPGLGFLLLNKTRWAVNTFFLVIGLLIAGLFVPDGIWSNILLDVCGLVWFGQGYYAVQSARLKIKQDKGEVVAPRDVSPLSLPPSNLTRGEKLAFKVGETLRQQLLPGEFLKDAVLALVMPWDNT
jgi:uncharacterized membrane protein